MHRSVLLLLMSALLLSAAAGLPLSLEESAEKSLMDLLLEDVWESEELLDFIHENSIHKRAAKDSSSSSEEHKDKPKDKANSSGASSSEEQKTTTDQAAEESTTETAEESTTETAARRRRQTITKDNHKRAAKDPNSSSEEHKDKANSSGESSSEEHKTTTTQAPVRRRRSKSPEETCGWMAEKLSKGESIVLIHYERLFEMDEEDSDMCLAWLENVILNDELQKYNRDESNKIERVRRQASGQDQQQVQKVSGELELDAQAEKELDEEMARAVADIKDNGSIEDYAQGCEVMEVSSKEANEATYAE